MVFEIEDGQLVIVEVNNNVVYGYDVCVELVGEVGSIVMNNVVYICIDILLVSSICYDVDWCVRYVEFYCCQNVVFFSFVEIGVFLEIGLDCWDGYCVVVVVEVGVKVFEIG